MKNNTIISLWSPVHMRYVKMFDEERLLGVSPLNKNGILPSNWDSEKFLVIDAGYDKVALWNPHHKRFIKMFSDGSMGASPRKEDGKLPSNWTSEVFEVEQRKECFAFRSTINQNFIKMTHDDKITSSNKILSGEELFLITEL
jgi:hypothetical protein